MTKATFPLNLLTINYRVPVLPKFLIPIPQNNKAKTGLYKHRKGNRGQGMVVSLAAQRVQSHREVHCTFGPHQMAMEMRKQMKK